MLSLSEPLKPQRVMFKLEQFVKQRNEMWCFLDIGNCTGLFNHYVQLDPPRRVFGSYGFSSMGWANAAVIGAKKAAPHVPCVAVTGDGAFLMNGVEIQAASKHRIRAIYLVLNDNFYGTVHHGELAVANDDSQMDDDFYGLGAPDIASFAEALGARSYRVSKPGELCKAIELACTRADKEKQPQVIVARIDHRELTPLAEARRRLFHCAV